MNSSRHSRTGIPGTGRVFVVAMLLLAWHGGAVVHASEPYGGPSFSLPSGTGEIFRFATEAGRDAPNPHAVLPCTACHEELPEKGATVEKALAGLRARPAELCGSCHAGYINIHPTGVEPPDAPPAELPLDEDGNLTCTTCHRLHLESARFSLLRGFGEEEGNRYAARRDLCFACHGDAYRVMNPHRSRGKKQMCVYCHLDVPEKGDDRSPRFRVNVLTMCNFCHGMGQIFHPLNVNPELLIPDGLPRSAEGSVHCGTCHNPHGAETAAYYLRTDYVKGTQGGNRLKGHGPGADCSVCHVGTGTPSAEDPRLHFGGDMIVLCNSCHGTTPDPHPVAVSIPGVMRRPGDVPLAENGTITCITCHDVDCRAPEGTTPGNSAVSTRFFDRGSGDNSLCFRCHPKEQWSGFTPHMEVDRNKTDYDRNDCLFCHDIAPSWSGDSRFTVSVAVAPKMLCLMCHPERNHPAGVHHGVRPVGVSVPPDMRLDRLGFVTCTTCHDVHSASPLDRRSEGGDRLCLRCHSK